MDRSKLPVEIQDNLLPEEDGKRYQMYYDYRKRTSGGFLDALFSSFIICSACFDFVLLFTNNLILFIFGIIVPV